MVGILVVSHGGLADALIASVQSLVGNLQRTRGVSIWPKEKEEEVKDRVRKEIAEVDDAQRNLENGSTSTYRSRVRRID